MRNVPPQLQRSLEGGVTHFCYCWRIMRRDGQQLGLTDHDCALAFDETVFHPDAAISLSSIDTRLGLHVPLPDIEGALNERLLTNADLAAQLYDDAAFELWLVDWQQPDNRLLLLVGRFGHVRRSGAGFHISLNHHGDALAQHRGRVYQKTCDAALGDARCRADISAAPFRHQVQLTLVAGAQIDVHSNPEISQPDEWFTHGHIGEAGAKPLLIRADKRKGPSRLLHLWQEAPRHFEQGMMLDLVVGCDKRLSTCQQKFSNALNYQGFPDLADDAVLIHIGADE